MARFRRYGPGQACPVCGRGYKNQDPSDHECPKSVLAAIEGAETQSARLSHEGGFGLGVDKSLGTQLQDGIDLRDDENPPETLRELLGQ